MPTARQLVPGEGVSWRRLTLPGYACVCTRCDHGWIDVPAQAGRDVDGPPRTCPRCRSPYWHTPKGVLPIGQGRRKVSGKAR